MVDFFQIESEQQFQLDLNLYLGLFQRSEYEKFYDI